MIIKTGYTFLWSVIFGLLFTACGNKAVRKLKRELKKASIEESTHQPISYEYNREKEFEKYYTLLRKHLLENKIPDFIYDECLDTKNLAYCRLSFHDYVSLRYDLINKLPRLLQKKLQELADKDQLDKKCEVTYMKEVAYSNQTTWEILLMILKTQDTHRE